MEDRVIIFDTTLRDGEQSPGAGMNAQEKLRLAVQLEKLGVDVLEAGFPASSPGDLEAVRSIAEKVRRLEVAALARTSKEDIDAAWSAVKEAQDPRIHVFIATSDIHLEHKLRMTREEVLREAAEAVRYAKQFTENVEFSAEDGSRSDRDFLCRVFGAAVEAGATTVNLPDTVGYALPDEFEELVRYVRKKTPGIGRAVLSVHCHNDLGLATANTLAGLKAGARQVEVTMNGIGERAGNTALEEVAMSLHTRRDIMGLHTGIRTAEIHPTSRLVKTVTGIVVQPNKAVVGANAFAHEAGIHQDGVLKNKMTYEIMEPEMVGLTSNSLVLGKHSGRHALKRRLEELGYDLTEKELNRLFKRFKELADKRKEILDEDIEVLVAEEILRCPDQFELDYLNVVSGTVAVPTATVKLRVRGEERQGAGFGIGPIDATFNTIAKLAGSRSRLLRFSVNAISGGMDAQGEVTVRLQENGLVALGRGADPDIITASAKAFVNGLNRIEYMKRNPSRTGEITL
ncbi:MAG: 2-isopropylmalate synthase [Deltaproteobacteria bacterium]|nr:2-isopropylmalate synthase [Deltaproteobacteria bacterium]MBW1948345.1 2-isopropylmalate synthase [Deltaproteobacteria bacterium]MBW2006629.1 2-isopropylmalate synthase [Deltaproteobacteria bacterium]MBW2347219.1 2-isopropylmalate synthase [Deltaproteobacteria bacterium]RLB40648.1 MAG: 2-isopropylmalate synthase [Deltaproteobacteria bacterium]